MVYNEDGLDEIQFALCLGVPFVSLTLPMDPANVVTV